MNPWKSASATTSGTVMTFSSASAANANDCSMASTCVHSSMRCRSMRSTSTPAKGASTKVGICPAKLTTPSSSAEPVRRYTSQLVAMRVIQVPTSDTPCPPKYSR
jgi:hypothetical protein